MKRHTIELSERELRLVLTAFDVAREHVPTARAYRYWTQDRAVVSLYDRLLHLGETATVKP